MPAKQTAAVEKIQSLMMADGFEIPLVTRPLADEIAEFGGDEMTADADPGAVVVFRDADTSGLPFRGEHIVPDDGLILDRAGQVVAR